MAEHAWIEVVGESMVEAAEHHAAAGQGFDRGQAKTLTHAATTPVGSGVVEVNSRTIEQVNEVIHPTALHFHPQAAGPKSRHQPLQHIAAALALLHQHINGARA